MSSAAAYWEEIIEDDHVLTIRFGWDDLSDSGMTLASHILLAQSGGRETVADIRFDTQTTDGTGVITPRPWYFDPTPADDSDDYNLTATLYEGLSSSDQSTGFNGTPPGTFEVGYRGPALGSAPVEARDGFDLLSVALHEIGHALGMSSANSSTVAETGDRDYDVPPALLAGASVGVKTASSTNIAHLAASRTLMFPFTDEGVRTRPSAADVFAMAATSNWSNLDLFRQDMLQGADLNNPANWEGNSIPDAQDDAYIRATSVLNTSSTADFSSKNLFIQAGNRLSVTDSSVTIGSALSITTGGALDVGLGGTVVATQLTLDGSTATLSGGQIHVENITNDGGTIGGVGVIHTTTFMNQGELWAGDGALELDAASFPDLDGGSGNGVVMVSDGDLLVTAPIGMAAFAGTMTVSAGREFAAPSMTLQNLGTIHLGGRLVIDQFSQDAALNIVSPSAAIDAETVFKAGSATFLDGTVTVDGPTQIEPGALFTGTGGIQVGPNGSLFADGVLPVSLVNGGGSVNPGSSPGVLVVPGFTQSAGTLRVEIGGITPGVGGYDQLDVQSVAGLADTLQVELLPGFDPQYEDEFQVLRFDSRTGNFDSLLGAGVSEFMQLAPVWAPDGLTLVAALPGDVNFNGEVSIGDLSVLASNFGDELGFGSWRFGDFNHDGRVSIGDLSILVGNFGLSVVDLQEGSINTTSLSIEAAAAMVGIDLATVPEPRSFLIVAIGGALLTFRSHCAGRSCRTA